MSDPTPTRDEFMSRWEPGLLIPVAKEIPGDLETPVSAYLKLASRGACFLLESVESGESLGRYSFIGLHPARELRFAGDRVEIRQGGDGAARIEVLDAEGPLAVLRRELGAYRIAGGEALPPLLGGAVGYFGYDLVRHFERIPTAAGFGGEIPEAIFFMTRALVVFDHVKRTTRVVVLAGGERDAAASYQLASLRIEETLATLAGPVPRPSVARAPSRIADAESNQSRQEYEERVERAKEFIRAGDIFQVVLSQRITGETFAHPFQVYRALRMLNPSPYMFYLDFGSFQFVGSSPEALVTLEDGVASIRPIAGTRRRGATEAENEALRQELLADEKERAEHVMLVDLARNDLGRVARYGTVKVNELMHVERYSHVMHIVSNVVGRLRPECDMFDLFRAAFPAGTVSGAPKVRAMEIIQQLEPEPRGPYAGAVGYFGYGDQLDTCIAIRTVLMKEGRFWLQAGAGIVADSVPAREYEETMKKMEALRRALEQAEEGW